MRCVNVRLPKQYIDILQMYGSLDDVTDKALDMVYTDLLPPINEMPAVSTLPNACKRVIRVTNEEYDDNCKLLGPKHHANSIKRLLTYIVDNEIYLNWPMRKLQVILTANSYWSVLVDSTNCQKLHHSKIERK